MLRSRYPTMWTSLKKAWGFVSYTHHPTELIYWQSQLPLNLEDSVMNQISADISVFTCYCTYEKQYKLLKLLERVSSDVTLAEVYDLFLLSVCHNQHHHLSLTQNVSL